MNCLICGQRHDTTICPDKPIPASPNLFCPGCGYALDGWIEPRLQDAKARAEALEAAEGATKQEWIKAMDRLEAAEAEIRKLCHEAIEYSKNAEALEAENTRWQKEHDEVCDAWHKVQADCRRLREVLKDSMPTLFAARNRLGNIDVADNAIWITMLEEAWERARKLVRPEATFLDALTPPEAQAGPVLVELPTTTEERHEIAGILGVPETQIHKLDMQRGGKA
jgi:hypothetical protein